MSADNWRFCPRCLRDHHRKRNKAKEDAKMAYGRVPIERFETMCRAADGIPEYPEEETLREDYQIGIDESGQFYVRYRGSCQHCGLVFTFKHDEDIPESEATNGNS